MSKKISEMGPKGTMVDADEFTILDSADANLTTKNKRVLKSVALAGLAPQSAVDAVQANLDSHETTNAGSAHPDGTTLTDLTNHKTGTNQHPISGVTGLQAALDAKADTASLGTAATRDVGTLPTEVAAGDAPANAVSAHESSFDHANLPTTAQKAALDANATLSGANAVAGANDLPTADQQAALDAANSPSGANAFATNNDLTHANLPDTATDGHPGGAINIPAGVENNAVAIAADGSLKDAGFPPGGWSGLHADLTDKATDGHPGTVITIGGGVEGNAVSIAADGSLQDSGVPPAGGGGVAWGDITGTLSNQTDLQTELDNKKDDFAENTAFNKNFGAVADTVCQGNDSRLSDARTPTAHAASHGAGQSDEIDAADLGSGAASNGQVLTADGAGGASWAAAGGGGDIDGAEVIDWRLRQQDLGTITGNVQVDLDLGHKIIGTMDGLGDWEIDFVSGRGHAVTDWKATLDVAGRAPVWRFGGALITLPEGYDISGTPSVIGFSFERDGLGTRVSERKYQ